MTKAGRADARPATSITGQMSRRTDHGHPNGYRVERLRSSRASLPGIHGSIPRRRRNCIHRIQLATIARTTGILPLPDLTHPACSCSRMNSLFSVVSSLTFGSNAVYFLPCSEGVLYCKLLAKNNLNKNRPARSAPHFRFHHFFSPLLGRKKCIGLEVSRELRGRFCRESRVE